MSVAVNEILSLSFKGRASRGAYWRTLAALAVLAAAGGLALDSLSSLAGGGAAQKGLDLLIWGWLLFLAAFLVSWPSCAGCTTSAMGPLRRYF